MNSIRSSGQSSGSVSSLSEERRVTVSSQAAALEPMQPPTIINVPSRVMHESQRVQTLRAASDARDIDLSAAQNEPTVDEPRHLGISARAVLDYEAAQSERLFKLPYLYPSRANTAAFRGEFAGSQLFLIDVGPMSYVVIQTPTIVINQQLKAKLCVSQVHIPVNIIRELFMPIGELLEFAKEGEYGSRYFRAGEDALGIRSLEADEDSLSFTRRPDKVVLEFRSRLPVVGGRSASIFQLEEDAIADLAEALYKIREEVDIGRLRDMNERQCEYAAEDTSTLLDVALQMESQRHSDAGRLMAFRSEQRRRNAPTE